MRNTIAVITFCLTTLFAPSLYADVSRIQITSQETLSDPGKNLTYQKVEGKVYLTLNPADPGNAAIADIAYAPTNGWGLVEYAVDFKLLIPSSDIANGVLLYGVNNRGRLQTPPENELENVVIRRTLPQKEPQLNEDAVIPQALRENEPRPAENAVIPRILPQNVLRPAGIGVISQTPPVNEPRAAKNTVISQLTRDGYTYLITGWINELQTGDGRIRLHAPVVSEPGGQPITGDVRYELSVSRFTNEIEIAGAGHLAYRPTLTGVLNARLTRRPYQTEPRIPIDRSSYELKLEEDGDASQPRVFITMEEGFEPGVLYELIYEAQEPVLAGAGMAAIRDIVSLIRYRDGAQLAALNLPDISHTIAYGFSQSGRLLRQFVYDGFNADLQQRKVFDGVVPFIAGGGYGMFNMRFAMPTRTNGHHSNYLYPNDLFPFTYGESTDPYTGKTDSLLARAWATDTAPKIMHIQTTNEYWLRAGSLPHTNPQGTLDADIPDEVRFYTIGGSPHGSGDGSIPGEPTTGQLPRNPNMWQPIGMSLLVAMKAWIVNGISPPPSVYPKISDGTLVQSHFDDAINTAAWNPIRGYAYPASMYLPAHADYGSRFEGERIVDSHPDYSDYFYRALVPAVDGNNNDLASSTILPPLTRVPLATFVSWNLRNPATGAEHSLARLTGGYIPLARNPAMAQANRDQRDTVDDLYDSFDDYLAQYEVAVDILILKRFILPEFKPLYLELAYSRAAMFE